MSGPEGELKRIVVLGASAGGVNALRTLVGALESSLPASVAVVMHVSSQSPGVLPQILSSAGKLRSKTAQDGEQLLPGRIYVAPPGQHLLISDGTLCLLNGARENRMRPSIDVLFRSAAVAHGSAVIGVILTGMLDDGASGLEAVKRCGGVAIVQDPDDAEYRSMPESALATVDVDHKVRLKEIGPLINRLSKEPLPAVKPVPEDLRLEVRMTGEGASLDELRRNAGSSDLSCPACGGRLWAFSGGKSLHYRCEVGHGYNLASLLSGNGDGVEQALWSAIRLLQERGRLLEKLAESGFHSASGYMERAEESRRHADQLKQLLITLVK